MARYRCSDCGYVYDEAKEGTPWSDLPDEWTCPVCGAAKSEFEQIDSVASGPAGWFSPSAARGHRVFGYAYLVLYLYFVWQMAPRLWSYQIEFPARTVAHLVLGMAVGAALLIKILIVRYFKRLDAALVPQLGTGLLIATAVLIGLSAPFAFQLTAMERASAAEGLLADDNLDRVRMLLAQTELGESASDELASATSLMAGRDVLRGQCIECHDLRTVLARPRTPENWLQTVRRMADRSTFFNPLNEQQQQQVTAYLIAVSPQIQRSTQKLREQQAQREQSRQAVEAASAAATEGREEFDSGQAQALFTEKCSKCHALSLVDQFPPASSPEARLLVERMVEEGLTGTQDELNLIIQYLNHAYAPRSRP